MEKSLTIQETKDGAQFYVKVTAGAKKTRLIGRYGDAVKVSVQPPPADGKANKELVEFLARLLEVPKSSVRIVRGETSNYKLVSVSDVSAAEVNYKIVHG